MKRYIILSISAILFANMWAQENVVVSPSNTETTSEAPVMRPANAAADAGYNAAYGLMEYSPDEYGRRHFDPFMLPVDSLHLPAFTADGRVVVGRYPFYRYGWGGLGTWDLHRGLNVSLNASVFAQFGRHAHHGAGFAQGISAIYAEPLTDKLSVALGGYFNNVYWGRSSDRDAGVTGVLSYRFDDHWEAFLYGQKSLTTGRYMPYPMYDMELLGDRIGAAVRYNVNPSFSFEVSVERSTHGR